MSWVSIRTTNNKYELYAYMEQQYGRGHERVCIDGKRTASCKCTGCCMYDVHPGFLTEMLRDLHRCEENNCIHYLPKPRKINLRRR